MFGSNTYTARRTAYDLIEKLSVHSREIYFARRSGNSRMARVFIDLDDFYEQHHSLDLLTEIKEEIPQFRVTLFTIPARCSMEFVRFVQTFDWIDMVPHGWLHRDTRECETWSYRRALEFLDVMEAFRLTKGFKAPGWQISDGTYLALLERGYWVADQTYNNHRRPTRLRVYLLDSSNKIHGHIRHSGVSHRNEIDLLLPAIRKRRNMEFGFVRDAII